MRAAPSRRPSSPAGARAACPGRSRERVGGRRRPPQAPALSGPGALRSRSEPAAACRWRAAFPPVPGDGRAGRPAHSGVTPGLDFRCPGPGSPHTRGLSVPGSLLGGGSKSPRWRQDFAGGDGRRWASGGCVGTTPLPARGGQRTTVVPIRACKAWGRGCGWKLCWACLAAETPSTLVHLC